jgi:hypothetical protein
VIKGDFLRRFSPGDVVDSSADFATFGGDIFKGPTSNIFYGLRSAPLVDSDPFGYLQLDILPNADLHLDAFAFQDNEVDGAPIPTGVPEPGTLSLFVVGGAALLAARRRKKQKAAA